MIRKDIKIAELKKFETNLIAHLGIEYLEIGEDYITGKMPVDHRTQQPIGILHGGASVVLGETLASLGANLCIDTSEYYCVGLEVNANHIRSVREGYVYCKASVVHCGRTTQVWSYEITNNKGEKVCVGRMTAAVLKK